jgi:hypothetical protein
MAGRRRSSGVRGVDGSVRARSATGRAQRIRDTMHTRYAQAATESARLAVAMDFVRSAAAASRTRQPVSTEQALSQLVRQLLRTGESLLNNLTTTTNSTTSGTNAGTSVSSGSVAQPAVRR